MTADEAPPGCRPEPFAGRPVGPQESRIVVVVVVVVVVSGWYQRDLVSYFGDRCCDRCYFVLGDDLPTWKMLLVCFVVGDRRSLRDDLVVVLL